MFCILLPLDRCVALMTGIATHGWIGLSITVTYMCVQYLNVS